LLAFTGFASLVSVFRQQGGKWLPQDTEGIKVMLEHTLASTFFGLLPLQLLYQFETATVAWRLSSFFLALFLLVEVLFMRHRIKKLRAQGMPPRRPWALKYFYFPITLGFVLLEMSNAFLSGELAGHQWGGSMVCYTWALLWLITAPAIQFLALTLGHEQ
jgi:hypothetical protein